jgi:hypothetical protein
MTRRRRAWHRVYVGEMLKAAARPAFPIELRMSSAKSAHASGRRLAIPKRAKAFCTCGLWECRTNEVKAKPWVVVLKDGTIKRTFATTRKGLNVAYITPGQPLERVEGESDTNQARRATAGRDPVYAHGPKGLPAR